MTASIRFDLTREMAEDLLFAVAANAGADAPSVVVLLDVLDDADNRDAWPLNVTLIVPGTRESA